MNIRTIEEGGALIALPTGRIDSSNARKFDDALRNIVDTSRQPVVVDFASLSYIGSAGLRAILLAAKAMQERKQQFMICSLSEAVQEVIEISGFDQVIPVHGSRAEALATVRA